MVRQQGSFYVDEGYISSDMSSSPRSPALDSKKNHQSPPRKSVQKNTTKLTATHEASNLSQLNESLMQEMSMLHAERHYYVVKIDELEDELHTMDLKNEALEREIQQLGGRFQVVSIKASEVQDQLKQQLHVEKDRNNRDLSSVLQRAEDAENAMADVISKIDGLSRELEQLTSSEVHATGDEHFHPEFTKEIVEEELQRLTEAVAAAKQEIINATSMLDVLREEGDVVKEHNRKLETALASTQKQCQELETQELQLAEMLSKLNKDVRTMAADDAGDNSGDPEFAATALPLFVGQISQAQKSGTTLEKDYATLRNSVWRVVEALKQKQLQISKLETQLFAVGDNKKALEVQVRRLSTTSAEASKHAKEEVTRMRERIVELTDTLEQSEASTSQLRTELEAARRKLRKRELASADYGLPILAASASLTAVGVCLYLSSKKR
ncbi:hypothetical protein SELMODRAFT_413349 [Selaginella moellendorffii]|uniref:Uncharacterized protein n=1 Tax=Selaginella moellendorffii TaxID=88036 RepID=D8RP66_SELML|nr:hypothetical protein SELMODRAFT_413349 [Selaginella moellendorffii]